MKTVCLIVLSIIALMGCSVKRMDNVQSNLPAATQLNYTVNGSEFSYLALGDSYTIGEAVATIQSFPHQLASALYKQDYAVSEPIIVARTGWTTDELIQEIKVSGVSKKFDIVTLLIGVNNQYRHYDVNTYRSEFVQLLNTALSYANGNKKRVFVISIPDWGVTPFAKGQDRNQIAIEIDLYNAINKEESAKLGVNYTDITPLSRRAINDLSLIADDGLHPSGSMYALWVQELVNKVAENIND
jgi:lysophospholipase L1-like esterase